MKQWCKVIICLLIGLMVPAIVAARIGVGVGTGKIQIDEAMYPGTIYQLPELTVVNTGDEPSEYEVGVEYHEQQAEKMPSREWFRFLPDKFYLEPGKVQRVEMKLDLPIKVEPGKYFAYLEGRPLQKAESGVTRIGIAAATKIYFEIKPANAVLGVYYKALSFWKVYAPWPARVTTGVVILAGLILFKKFFKVKISKK